MISNLQHAIRNLSRLQLGHSRRMHRLRLRRNVFRDKFLTLGIDLMQRAEIQPGIFLF